MFKQILYYINQFSFAGSIIKVNKLFFVHDQNKDFMRLQNNFVFRHACMTPLTILNCTLENLEKEQCQKQKKETVEIAKEAVLYLTKLIAAVTKTNETEQKFNVNDAINEAVFLFKSKTGCCVYYSNFLPKRLQLFGSKLYFQEIIICLLNNAYEAYQDKKLVHISLSVRIIKGQVFLGVVDFAKGMTQLGQKLALVKGVSYKENGLGLGLTFVKKTIEAEFKGVLKIISGYGVGTHVQVAIPIPEPYSQSLLRS
ncbi:HAMP domain-containing histidine kinase [Candidatus Woesebacteria bacterium]|nr:HAMP domain-containing histidine kinase [Candidatus Woesebacteria bacterium]